MISDVYSGVPKEIRKVIDPLVSEGDDYHKVHYRRMARTLKVILDQNPKGKLLELGTSGLVPLALKKLTPELEVHVTDFDLSLPSSGEHTVSLCGQSTTLPCYRLNLEEEYIPVADETFDYVLCSEVVEHMEVDPMFMLSEVNRVLKPNGMLILSTPNIASSRNITKMLNGLDPYFYMQYRHTPSLYRHNYEYTVYSITSVVTSAGFNGSIWTEDTFEDPIMRDIDKLKEIGYTFKHIGDNIFVVARKIGPVVDRHPAVIYAD
jgi:ubiquinone/menaquinone biosynthesis C-methylase UbiE